MKDKKDLGHMSSWKRAELCSVDNTADFGVFDFVFSSRCFFMRC